MIKKLIKFVCIAAIVLLVLVSAGLFTLYKMYPPAKLKGMLQQYVADNFHREVTFEDLSFTWIGFTLKNFALSENNTFSDGTFIKADKLTAHVAVKPLLKKRIEISTIESDGLTIQIIQKKDGSFNFDTLLSQEQSQSNTSAQPAEENTPLVLTAQKIALTDCNIVYQNEQTDMRLALNNLNITVTQFGLNNPFKTQISFTTDISGTNQPEMQLPVTLQAVTHLAGLDLSQAYTTLTEASAQYKSIVLRLTGDIKNFQAPQINLTGSLSGINNKVLRELAPQLPNFTLPVINLTLQANANLDQSIADINLARLSVKNSAVSVGGKLNWKGDNPTYTLNGDLTANLNELVQMTDTVQDFQPGGLLSGSFKATDKKNYGDVTATLTLKNISALYPPVTLTQTNGTVVVNSLDKITVPQITGKLNGEKFKLSFSYQNIKNVLNMVLNLNLDKLTLKELPSSTAAAENENKNTQAPAGPTTRTASARMNIQANVTVGALDIPYVKSDGFTLSAQLTDLTDSMNYTNGTIRFTLNPGKITNLDDFIKESKIAKIILLPLSIVKKVAGVLKINLFSSDTTENGAFISFTQGEGAYTFTNGIMNVDKTTFNSTVTNISATGTANFKTDALDMRATATLLTQAAPVSFKITGTMANPKGKLDVLNTVSSVVGNLLNGSTAKSAAKEGVELTKGTAQTAGNTVKDTVDAATNVVKGFGSLFKKKKTEEK